MQKYQTCKDISREAKPTEITKVQPLYKIKEPMKWNAKHLPGIQGPNHASLLSNSNLKHELSSHPEATLLF
jgi:hypothetical protein